MTTPTLPIATRNLKTIPLKAVEINLILDYLLAHASSTSLNMVTGIGTIAPQFLAGLQAFMENHRSLQSELAKECISPKAALKDEYGNASVIIDNF
jgi:hypothetical protein